jgi:protein disulfide-isomerase A1
VVLYKKFDEGQNVFTTTPITAVGLSEFIKENSVPLLDEVTPENFATYAEQGLPIAYVFSKPDDSRLKTLVEELKPVAKAFKGKLNFVWIDGVKFEDHGKSLGVPTSEDPYPVFVIQDLANGNKRYVLTEAMKDKLTADAVNKFVTAFDNGEIEPHVKSAEVPATQDEPVYVLVSKEFEKVVLDDSKDVFVEIYAPWCGHCRESHAVGCSFADFGVDDADLREAAA